MGKHSIAAKNVAGWVTRNHLSMPPAVVRNSERAYDYDVIRYAFQEYAELLERFKPVTLPEFGGLIQREYAPDPLDPEGAEIVEAVRVLKKYPPQYVNSRDNSIYMRELRSNLTKMMISFEKSQKKRKGVKHDQIRSPR